MSTQSQYQYLWRASYDNALCTIRSHLTEGQIPDTKGEWLGIEWDDLSRGKHNGTFKGHKYFECKSKSLTCASFVRPSRKTDREVTVLEAVDYKYGSGPKHSEEVEVVVISGKIAEEVGFDKIAREQSVFSELRIVVIERAKVFGLASRGSPKDRIYAAQTELARTCPNIVELDLSYNVIETWEQVEMICAALPKLKTLKLNGLRLASFERAEVNPLHSTFANLQELHLNECLLSPSEIVTLLSLPSGPRFPALKTLWLSQNELDSFMLPDSQKTLGFEMVQDLVLEHNLFSDLSCLQQITTTFPNLKHISLQSNRVEVLNSSPVMDHQTDEGQYPSFRSLQSINLSYNNIKSFDFIDELVMALPNLRSLRVSKNPLYDVVDAANASTSATPSERYYYLTLARIPSLEILNYSNITAREREEGEIYYLSVAEKDIKSILLGSDLSDKEAMARNLKVIQLKYPRYESLCEKHDRESLSTSLLSSAASNPQTAQAMLKQENRPKHALGSIASRLVLATFHIATKVNATTALLSASVSEGGHGSKAMSTHLSFSKPLPLTIPTSYIFALVSRTLDLPPLQFKMIYESPELDPVRDDVSTRSQLYKPNATTTSSSAIGGDKVKGRWDDWGDWDVDNESSDNKNTSEYPDLVEKRADAAASSNTRDEQTKDLWTEEGYLVSKDGRKWKRREIEMLLSVRAWGDWLDIDVNEIGHVDAQGKEKLKEIKIRIEPF